MKTIDVNSQETRRCVDVLKIMAHPIRLSIALALHTHGPLNVSAIQELLSLSQSTVSQHISKMRDSSIVGANRQGTKIYYSLKDETAKQLIKNLQ